MRLQFAFALAPLFLDLAAAQRGKGILSLLKVGTGLAKIGNDATKIGATTQGSGNGGGSRTAASTPAMTTNATTTSCASTDTPCLNCALAAQTLAACSSAIPHFDDLSDADLAKCVCYNPAPSNSSSFVWVPNAFDKPFDACPTWAKTAAPSDASALAQITGFCQTEGNVLNVTSTDTATFNLATVTGGAAGLSSALQSGTKVTGSQTAGATGISTAKSGADVVTVSVFGVGIGAAVAALLIM